MSTTVDRLQSWVEACLYELAVKLSHTVPRPDEHAVDEFLLHLDWHRHQRLEANARLYWVSRGVMRSSLGGSPASKIQRSWATRTLLNRRRAFQEVERAYRGLTGRHILKGSLELDTLTRAL